MAQFKNLIASEASKIFWQFQMPEWRFYVLESLLDLIQDNFLQIPDFFQTGTPIPDFFQTFQTFPDFCVIPDISGRCGNPGGVLINKNIVARKCGIPFHLVIS